MKRLILLLVGGVAALGLVAPAAAKTVVIGASLPLTGGFAINGTKHKEGYELCVELINKSGGLLGDPIKLIISDNQSDVETAMSQFERLINVDKVDVLLGTFSSKITFPTTSVAEQTKMVYPIPSGVALQIYERGYKHIFNFQPNAAEYVGNTFNGVLKDLVDSGMHPKKVALVYADDFYADAVVRGLLGKKFKVPGTDREIDLSPGALAEAGTEVVLVQQWPEEGFSDWITLANTVKSSGADFVVGFTASPDEAIQLVRAFKTVNYQPKAVLMGQGTQAEFEQALGSAANGIMIHSAWHPSVKWEGLLAGKKFTNQDFLREFSAKYGKEGDEDHAIPFATCEGMTQAVRVTGSTDNTVLRDWLASRSKASPVKTILGDFYWDERGLPMGKPFLMTQWQNQKLEFIYPIGQFPGTSDVVWPKPTW